LTDTEIVTLIASAFLTLKSWSSWYADLVSVNQFRLPLHQRLAMGGAPVISVGLILVALKGLAATDVRSSPFYIAFYVLVGMAWVGGARLIFPFIGISARDDVLERGNSASTWAVVGALIGISCCFVGGNIGNGPGVVAVLFSSVLSSTLFFALWFVLDCVTGISDAITIDRTNGAGIRLAGYLVGLGLLSGWSVAGDWVSVLATIKDFVQFSWPPATLSAIAVVIELTFRRVLLRHSAGAIPSAVISAAYVGLGLAWVAARGLHS
jgi:uncharacterized membrane protein YjfL (UPF0719 family)